MGNFIDMTRKKFGRLTVIKRSYPNTKYGNSMWLCKCDCGNERRFFGHALRSGHTKSCGCLHKERISLPFGLASIREKIKVYKSNAKTRGHKYELTEKQFKEITQKNCFYCGVKPGNISKSKSNNGDYVYNGLDRVDNKKGYNINNVVACCWLCNNAKKDLTIPEFKAWIERVHNNMFVKGVNNNESN